MLLSSNMDTFCPVVNGLSIEYGDIRRHKRVCAMRSEQEWISRVQGILKAELKRRNLTYRQLAERLEAIGVHDTELNIKNKISRGGFTAVFFVQCLVAIGCQALDLR